MPRNATSALRLEPLRAYLLSTKANSPILSPAELQPSLAGLARSGFCVLKQTLPIPRIQVAHKAFRPHLEAHLATQAPNRGASRHFIPLPFTRPIFHPDLFFQPPILEIIHQTLGDRAVADQWGCDVPTHGSHFQEPHADYARPLFAEQPHLSLPPYMLVASFGLVPIHSENGALEIAPGTHRLPRIQAQAAVASGEIPLHPIALELGDVLIRHPWTLHRGTPNRTPEPRPLLSIRWVRRWYEDHSRETLPIPRPVWDALPASQRARLRFTVAEC